MNSGALYAERTDFDYFFPNFKNSDPSVARVPGTSNPDSFMLRGAERNVMGIENHLNTPVL